MTRMEDSIISLHFLIPRSRRSRAWARENPVNWSSPTSSGVAEIYCKNYCGLSESVLHVSVDQNSSRTPHARRVDLFGRRDRGARGPDGKNEVARKWRRNDLKRLNPRPEMVWARKPRTHNI